VRRSRSTDGRWKSKFARFVSSYGVDLLASRLRVNPSAIYHWLSGTTSPHPRHAQAVQRLAKRRRIALSLEEIYREVRK